MGENIHAMVLENGWKVLRPTLLNFIYQLILNELVYEETVLIWI